jgi:hypothetical protein
MLYLSAPLGGGGGGGLHPKLGFRIEQVRMMGNNGAPDAPDPMQHRGLIGWQIDGQGGMHFSGMRMELGNHVTYDMAHGTFAISSRQSSVATLLGPRPLQAATVTAKSAPRPVVLSPSMLHEVAAAAVATLKSRAKSQHDGR